MLQEICIKTSGTILSILVAETEIREGAICEPHAYFGTIHRMLSGVLGIVAHHNLNADGHQSIDSVFSSLENILNSKCVFVQHFKDSSPSEKHALEAFLNWFQVQNFGNINLSGLYELMLGLEFPIKDDVIVEDHNGQILDTVGSFYTPTNLADKIVQLTLDNYIFQNTGIERFSITDTTEEEQSQVRDLLKHSTYADHSCGTGSFLLAILRYVRNNTGSETKSVQEQIVLHLEAIEADALALEIAKIQVLMSLNRLDMYAELGNNFIHGNPILRPLETNPAYTFSNEFYYHNQLAIDPKQLKKCDVIIGNPPWGEVGFDLAFFCHIILPKVNEVKSQQELEQTLGDLESSHPFLFDWLLEHEEANDLAVDMIYEDERFQNSTKGGLHTNVLFTEMMDALGTERGSIGLILKGSTLADSSNKGLLNQLHKRKRMVSRYDFHNTNRIFNIDTDEDFSILVLGTNSAVEQIHQTGLTKLSEIS